MKNNKKYIILILLQILIQACGVSKNTSNLENQIKEPQSNISWFYVFTIYKDDKDTNIVQLISKKEIDGKMKTESTSRRTNNLTFYLFSDKQLIDTVSIDHPLYKRYEYANLDGTLKYKDTIMSNADFVLRAESDIDEIKVFETLKNQPKKQLILKSF